MSHRGSGRRHKPRPPGRIDVGCTGRGEHERYTFRPPLQLAVIDGRLRIKWDSRLGEGPVTGYRDAEDWHTMNFKCPACPRHYKRGEREFIVIVVTLGQYQQITGNTPVDLDISRFDRA